MAAFRISGAGDASRAAGVRSRPNPGVGLLPFVAAFAALAVAIIVGGYAVYRTEALEVRTETAHELQVVAELKASAVAQWRAERIGDADALLHSAPLFTAVDHFLREPDDEVATGRLRAWLGGYSRYEQYDRTFLIDAHGVTRLSLPAPSESPSSATSSQVAEVLRTGELAVLDFYPDEGDQHTHMATIIPVLDRARGSRPIAVVVLRIDAQPFLFAFIGRWPTARRTAETLLLRPQKSEAEILTYYRSDSRTPLRRRVSLDNARLLAAKAVNGQTGLAEGLDDRLVESIAVLQSIPDSPWKLVTRLDIAELEAALWERLTVVSALGIALLFGAGSGLGLLWKEQQARHYRAEAESAAELRESDERYRTFFAANPHPMWVFDLETLAFLEVNDAAMAHYGYTRDEFLSMTIADIRPPEDVARLQAHLAVAQPRAIYAAGTWRHRLKDGSVISVETTSHRLDYQGRQAELVLSQDVTERERTEEALREREHLLSESQRIAHIGSWREDENGRTTWSEEMFRLFGLEPGGSPPPFEGVVGLVHPEDRLALQRASEANWRGETTTNAEFRVVRGDGTVRHLSGRGELVVDARQRRYTAGTVQDVTDRKLAEQARLEIEHRYRALVEHAPVGIFVERGNEIVLVNSACLRIFGATGPEQLLGREPSELFHPDSRSRIHEHMHRVQDIRETVTVDEGRILRVDGAVVDVEVSAARFVDGGGNAIHVVLRDVSEQKRITEELRHSRALLQGVVDGTSDAIFVKDLEGRYLMLNKAVERITGRRAEDVLGQDDRCLFPPAEAADLMARDRRTVENGIVMTCTEFLHDAAGQLRTFEATKGPILDGAGRPVGLFGISRDVTEQKVMEAALRTSVQEKEALLKEVHHRVKNNLQVITSLLRLEAGRSDHAAVKLVLGEMQNRILSMALLHETLYRSGNLARVDLSAYIAKLVTHLFRSAAPEAGRVALHLDLAPAAIEMDQAVPCGLLVNELVSNCLKHGFPDDARGDVWVELRHVNGGPQLRLDVRDNGVGLPADFTRRRAEGLGVQMVADLAGQLQGTLTWGPPPGASAAVVFEPRPFAHSGNEGNRL